jgi:hypothetical protein
MGVEINASMPVKDLQSHQIYYYLLMLGGLPHEDVALPYGHYGVVSVGKV